MKKVIRLTEKDILRIVKKTINEGMDNDTAHNVYRKLKHNGEIMDDSFRKIRNIREELDGAIMQHVRRETASSIFDHSVRTPADVSQNVEKLSRELSNLEYALMEYKRILKNTISL